jgi:metallopeptidase MepB
MHPALLICMDFRGQAYAQDLFVSSFVSDPMSREIGMRFRRAVLEPGAAQNGLDLMVKFLGREPNTLAMYEEIRDN